MLNIVLYQPEIPENTGNIARTCVCFNSVLHLIRPYGFFLTNKKMLRAGLDYWSFLSLTEYDDWNDFELKHNKQNNLFFIITKFGLKNLSNLKLSDFDKYKNIFFIFGKETSGLPSFIMEKYKNSQLRIEMNNKARCLNLANCVSIVSYHYHYLTKFAFI